MIDIGYTHKNPAGITEMHRIISEVSKLDNPGTLYHYTSMHVMDSLLKNSQFWASSIYYLNDAEEYYNGISYLIDLFSSLDSKSNQKKRQLLQAIRRDNGYSFEGLFSLSFSTQKDSLHQWITYAKEGGVCIGLDNDRLKEYMIVLDGMEDNYGKCSDVIAKARYLSKEASREEMQKAINDVDDMLRNALANQFDEKAKNDSIKEYNSGKFSEKNMSRVKDYFRLLVSYYKNAAFEIESEYRGVFFPIFIKHIPAPTIYYHVTSAGIVRPYIKVGFRGSNVYEGICPLPVKSITIGPAGNQQAVFNSVVHRVKYGTLKTWDYWEHKENEEFKNNFIEYICGALEGFAIKNTKKVSEKTLGTVFRALMQDWIYETDMRFASQEEQEDIMLQEYMPKLDQCSRKCKEKGIIGTESQKNSENATKTEILSYVRMNNYFSKEGIWVKKSQIPYVF